MPTKPIRVNPPQWDVNAVTVVYNFVSALERTEHKVKAVVTVIKEDGSEAGTFEETNDLSAAGPPTDDGTGGRQPRAPGLLRLEWSADDGYAAGTYDVSIAAVLVTPHDAEANGTLVTSFTTSLKIT